MRRSAHFAPLAVVAGCVVAYLAAYAAPAAAASGPALSAPLSGVLRADGVPLAGASLVVRGLTGAAASVVRVLKTDAEGTFCLADARPGVYSVLATVPGFRSASAQVLHRTSGGSLSFVRLDLDREPRGVLPAGPAGALDPWAARAVLAGDVLRDHGPTLAPPPVPETAPAAPAAVSATVRNAASPFPVRGTVSSVQGFTVEGGDSLSQTAVDVRGSLGGGVRWGLTGEYDRVMSAGGERLGGASSLALDVLPSDGHSIRLSSRRSEIPSFDNPDARLDAHSVDWAADAGKSSRASVSARILSHRNLEPAALPTHLFHGEGSALEVDARYRSDLGSGRFVRVYVGYRTDLSSRTTTASGGVAREARVGGVAGLRLLDSLLVEAGGTGDYSAASRGLTPELTLTFEALPGITFFGFASQRFEKRDPAVLAAGIVGLDATDLVRATRAHYRAGARIESHSAGRIEFEASRREISQAFQLLLDSEIVDRIDALYLFPGDIAEELSGSVTFAVRADVSARLALLGGRLRGDGLAAGSLSNDSTFWVSSARVNVGPTGTSVAVRYRLLEQELRAASAAYRAGRETVDVTLAQEIPIPVLRALGSRWEALVSVALGSRIEGEGERRPNRQVAGGLSLTF